MVQDLPSTEASVFNFEIVTTGVQGNLLGSSLFLVQINGLCDLNIRVCFCLQVTQFFCFQSNWRFNNKNTYVPYVFNHNVWAALKSQFKNAQLTHCDNDCSQFCHTTESVNEVKYLGVTVGRHLLGGNQFHTLESWCIDL